MSISTAPVSHSAKPLQTIPPSMTLRALLDARRADGRRMSLDEAIAVIVPVCLDLKERHDRGEKLYLHPSCIAPGADGLAKLNPKLALVPTNAFDRYCLAPELQSTLEPGDARASIYSVGAILYEMVTGSHIGPAMRRPRDVDPSLPESVEVLIGKAIIGDRTHRPADIGALASAMYHLAPAKSIHPPEVEEDKLDQSAELEVDVKFSMMPPAAGKPVVDLARPARDAIPKAPSLPRMSANGDPFGSVVQAPMSQRRLDDPTLKLSAMKEQLESDPRPRYVVNKDMMDHGPFTAVELLQQIASNTFALDHGLRDEISGQNKPIKEWEEFAPFAEQAGLKRKIVAEEKAVVRSVAAEKKSGIAKVVIGLIAVAAIVGALVAWQLAKRSDNKEKDARAAAGADETIEANGALKGKRAAPGAATWRGTGGGGAGPGAGPGGGGAANVGGGGTSVEAFKNTNNDTIAIGGADAPELTKAQLAAPMRIAGCAIPDNVKATVTVAVKNGRAAGVTASTDPSTPSVNGCLSGWARSLSWPSSPRAEFVTMSY